MWASFVNSLRLVSTFQLDKLTLFKKAVIDFYEVLVTGALSAYKVYSGKHNCKKMRKKILQAECKIKMIRIGGIIGLLY